MTQQPPSRFRFRFQTMMAIVTAIAILLGLVLREVHHERRKKQIIEAIKKDGGSARLVDPMRDGQAPKGFIKDWLRIFLGDGYFTVVPELGINSGSASLDEVVGYFPELQRIAIRDATDASLKQLPKLSKLNHVVLGGEFTDIGLDSLSRIESMRFMEIHECSFKDGSGAPVASCTRLRSLSFEQSELSSQILNSFQSIFSLAHIRFVDCKIDDELLNLLYGSANKVYLQLINCNVTQAGILTLRKANPDWEVQCFDTADAKIASQSANTLNIYPPLNEISEVLKVTFAGSLVTDATLITLADAVKLQELSVTHTARGSISAKGIEALQGLQNLNILALSFTQSSDVEVIAIAKLARLESLSLWGCPVTDASVEELAKLKSLKRLIVIKTAISESGLDRLRLALPNCEIVSKF